MTYTQTGREAVMIEGKALDDLLAALDDYRPRRLRVSSEGGFVRFKFDSDSWSPPYPVDPDPSRSH